MSDKSFEQKQSESYLSAQNQAYVEALYEDYLKHSSELPEEWRQYFSGLPSVSSAEEPIPHSEVQAYFIDAARKKTGLKAVVQMPAQDTLQRHVDEFVNAYREHGHLAARINPLTDKEASLPVQLAFSTYQLSESDLNKSFASSPQLLAGKSQASLNEIYAALKKTYCGSIGIEYMHIRNFSETEWLRTRFESTHSTPKFSRDEKLSILTQLVAADGLEKYLGTKYVGQKRFSLEGGDSFMPLMQEVTQRLGQQGAKEVVIGMAHRGRLNVLVNLMGKEPRALFDEFEGKKKAGLTSSDVKYHGGFSSDVMTPGGELHLSLAFNPSHLEMVSPVVVGSVRARQQIYTDQAQDRAVPILIHGDSAFAGQGIVMETFAMSQTRAYSVGGAIHVVINNQVGFTTSNPEDTRSSLYCTDIAKMVDAPILHVNGDDPEAVVFAAQIAVDYRMQFHKDIVIDLVCYRRHGHNEADEPSATQPVMYQFIRQHQDPWKLYAAQLAAEGVCTQEAADKMFQSYRDALDANKSNVELLPNKLTAKRTAYWKPYLNQPWNLPAKTGVPVETLKQLGQKLTDFPQGYTLQRQVGLMVEARRQMAQGQVSMDWGFAENLAYASLLVEKHHIRITGQDARRGTFSHRHAAFHDNQNGQTYLPLQHLSPNQAKIEIYDSLLSEAGVVGFEYGYSGTDPDSLVIWEAQFGDFANGAQVFIDQFLSASWQKWERVSGLVMLLPHGYEGAGPEHSSARLERFLQLCAEDNMQVCVPSTPAQIFHLLRRQVLSPCRMPLIVMSPKSLLRHKAATSTLDELATGTFLNVIPEQENHSNKAVKKVILCSGKVYYDLLAKRTENQQSDIAIVRMEQLYPFPVEDLKQALKPYREVKQIVWCQEEPKNQGAWLVISPYLQDMLEKGQNLVYAGRPASASTAAGYGALHNQQQQALLEQALLGT